MYIPQVKPWFVDDYIKNAVSKRKFIKLSSGFS